MDKLKKQISESFFNPILYFLPLMVFILGNNFFGLTLAWKISFPVAMLAIFYVHKYYSRLFIWYLILAASYLLIGFIFTLTQEYNFITPFFYYFDDVLFIALMLFLLLFKDTLRRIARRTLHPRMPMSNNIDELFRATQNLLIIISVFTLIFLFLEYKFNDIYHHYILYLNYFYLGIMFLLVLYETARVLFIRSRLIKEDWVPIVSKHGEVIGSEPYLSRVFGECKYRHPVVRMHVIQDGKILMQKHPDNDKNHPQMWDTAINSHVKVGESIQEALVKTVKTIFNAELKNTVFLSNYSYENNVELEYVFLFVTCCIPQSNISENKSIHTKWWTPKQIKENFNSGIFTEEFKHEYKLLERGGLIFSVHCVCDCELKELFRKQKLERINSQISIQPI